VTARIARLSERRAWNALTEHHSQIRELHLRKPFADDPTRSEQMTLRQRGLSRLNKPHHPRNVEPAHATGEGI
jgi:hypothetical protein